MTREENIRAILDTCFSESKDEIKEVALNNIMSLSVDTEEAVLNKMLKEEMIVLPQDYVKVVRCKDCRYCTEYYDRDGYPYWECAEWDGGTDADGFCHYGERKKK